VSPIEFSPQLCAVFVVLALHLCAVYTGLGAFPLALANEIRSASKSMVFLKKLAQQLSALGLMFLAYTLVAVAGSYAVVATQAPDLLRPWREEPSTLAAVVGVAVAYVLLALIYAFTWRSAGKSPLHRLLGLVTSAGIVALLSLSLCLKLAMYTELPETGPAMALGEALASGMGHAQFAPLLLNTILTCLACAAGFGLLFLLSRRKRDDFGRDYYGFAVRTLAGSAIVAALGTVASEAWVAEGMLPALLAAGQPTLLGWLALGGGAAGLIAALLWFMVLRAEAPLRSKPAMLLAGLMLLVTVGAFGAVNASIFLAL